MKFTYIKDFQSDSDFASNIIEINTDEDSNEDAYSMNQKDLSSDSEILRTNPLFIDNKSVGPQTKTNIVNLFEIFKLFFTDELIENIFRRTKFNANLKIYK